MREDTFYKVLWVEDDLSIIQGYQITAEAKDIELDVATNWDISTKVISHVLTSDGRRAHWTRPCWRK